MYLEHFGLHKLPFTLTPNTNFYCNLPGHQEALNVLLYSLKCGEGFIKITGEVGSGKTLLCRKLLNTIGDDYKTCYIPNPDLTSDGLRKAFAHELGIDPDDTQDNHQTIAKINEKLLQYRHDNKYVVLVIDEAQCLPDDSLEALRLLTNLETEEEKLLQIVLFGQPELDERLNQYQHRPLMQRISFSHNLTPISRDEIDDYIGHRLIVAGHSKATLFNHKAATLLFEKSKGVPRLINVLCHKALMSAYGRGEHKVGLRAMMEAVRDTAAIDSSHLTQPMRAHESAGVFGFMKRLFGLAA